MSENSNIFVIKKRGEKKPICKTAAEISRETELITKMDPQDAKTIGYAIANNDLKLEQL